MLFAMLLAHLIGDYILQWDALARWKTRSVAGAAVHGGIVLIVTVLFALAIDASWWPWALFIGGSHLAVDAGQQWLWPRHGAQPGWLSPLARFLLDQLTHLGFIAVALAASSRLGEIASWQGANGWWLVLGYAFITMPAWVLIEFGVHGLVGGMAPDFAGCRHKYTGIMERGLITTFVLLGQYVLVPLVTLPRLWLEAPRDAATGDRRPSLFVAEMLASMALAVATGLVLRLALFNRLA